jgi:hypothetical protein
MFQMARLLSSSHHGNTTQKMMTHIFITVKVPSLTLAFVGYIPKVVTEFIAPFNMI